MNKNEYRHAMRAFQEDTTLVEQAEQWLQEEAKRRRLNRSNTRNGAPFPAQFTTTLVEAEPDEVVYDMVNLMDLVFEERGPQ